MRIGIDIDGVLTDIEKWQLDVGSKYFYEKYNKALVSPDAYDTKEIFGVEEKLDNEFWQKYLLNYATSEPARKFAGEVIKKLKNNGSEIYIITARFLANQDNELGEKMRNIVIKWLEQYEIYYDKIIFSPDNKVEVCLENNITIMIEDSPKNIMQISKHIPVICYNARYNQECIGKNITRCYSWYDIYEKISKMITNEE